MLGPPGCGKTRRLLVYLDGELARCVPARRIAVLTFTRAARAEVVRRVQAGFEVSDGDLLWFRTIHSACFRLLGLSRDRVLGDEAYQAFAERHQYALSPQRDFWIDLDDAPREAPHRTPDDLLRYLHEWRRNACLSIDKALALSPVERIVPRDFLLFEERLAAFKREHDLVEFADMLQLTLELGLAPDVDVIFVDEAQDLSPLQIAVVESWSTRAKRVYVAGDDDQVIYRFQAADPAWLGALARQVEPEILTQSYRVPVAVHEFAQRIIRRNRRRTEKRYRPTAQMGEIALDSLPGAVARVARVSQQEPPESGTAAFVLVRNRAHIPRVAHELMDQDVIFRVSGPGGPDPLGSASLLRALAAAQWLAGDDDARGSVRWLQELLDRVPARGSELPRGVKARVGELKRESLVARAEALDDLGLRPLAEAIRERGPLAVMTKVPLETRRYLERVLAKHGCVPDHRVVLTTIHGAKGQEAPLVVLLSDMSRATYDAYQRGSQEDHEAENRVFYVGVTRAIETLILVEPNSRRHYEFPSLAGREGAL